MRTKNLLFFIGVFFLGISGVIFYLKASVMTTKEAIKTLREYDKQHMVYTPDSGRPIKIISGKLLEHFERYQAGKEDINDYPYIDTIIVQYMKKTLRAKEIEGAETGTDKTAQKDEKAAQHRWLVRCLEAFAAKGCMIRDFFTCCRCILTIEDKNSELMAFLCTKGIANTPHLINARDNDGATPLIVAAIHSTAEACKALIEAGADVNAKSKDDWTPLMFAAQVSTAEACKALIEAGADVNAKSKDGWTPLMLAAQVSTAEVCKALIEAGADVNARNSDGYTPLMGACGNPTGATVKILIEAGADVNARDNNGVTPLMLAAQYSTAEACKALIEAGADVNAKATKKEVTLMPLDIAALSGNDDIVDLLLKNGAEARLNNRVLSMIRDATEFPSEKEKMIKKYPRGKHRYQEVLNLLEAKINQ